MEQGEETVIIVQFLSLYHCETNEIGFLQHRVETPVRLEQNIFDFFLTWVPVLQRWSGGTAGEENGEGQR